MQVLKFGGTSVADATRMLQCSRIIEEAVARDRTIVVASAISGFTDALISVGRMAAAKDEGYKEILSEYKRRHHAIIRELLPSEKHAENLRQCDEVFDSLSSIAHGVYILGELSPASLDAIQGCGELVSSRILASKLSSLGISTRWVDSRQIIKTRHERGKVVVDSAATSANVQALLEDNPQKSLFVVPGFIASDEKGRMVTLGRGGSDYSASLYAVGSKARALETWKDVPGMMTADPKMAPSATLIKNISYRAALELSHFGAKVIYPPTIQPVVEQRIPIYVKCTFDPSGEGTVIEQNPPRNSSDVIGISNSDKIALLSLEGSGMVGVPGFSYRLFRVLSENDISIILITQASSVNTMCVAVSEKDSEKARHAVDTEFAYEISLGKIAPLKVETGYSIICLVGNDMLSQKGTTGRMLAALGKRSIAVRAVAQGSSERNISVIVHSQDVTQAVKCIHEEFFEASHYKDINLFVAGYGTVGKAFIDILAKNREAIAQRTGKRLHLAGISNSRKFVIDRNGIDPARAGELLQNGESAADEAYFEALYGISLQNSVFVDMTASSDISYKYQSLFERGYSVVASNKICFASSYAQYASLKASAVANHVGLRYETTVGAALPILESICRCVNAGDVINKVEAVLSGTLNYILSTYKGGLDGKKFADVVRSAQQAGYSEPDPRTDLCGRDVLRKLIILSREAGVPLEEEQVQLRPLLAPEFFEGDLQAFYSLLEKREDEFSAAFKAAGDNHRRFVATLERTPDGFKATVGLREIGPEHPLYNLPGCDNCALISSECNPSPLLIQGGGAGAWQTASGVLNDILL